MRPLEPLGNVSPVRIRVPKKLLELKPVSGLQRHELDIKDEVEITSQKSPVASEKMTERRVTSIPPLYRKVIRVSNPERVETSITRESTDVSIPLADMRFEEVHEMGITGKGVTVVVIDSGVRADHPDLKGKVIKWVDMSGESEKPFDDIGHGTHVSGIIAGSGEMSKGFYRGGAPGAKLIVIRVTNPAEVIKAIKWVKEHKDEYNIKVVNMSLGVDPTTSWRDDPLARGAQDLVDSGITVIAAAGNDYTYGTIDSPGVAPGVITVGGADDKGTYTKTDDTMYIASSRGPTPIDKLQKPDVIAYSTKVVSLRAPGSFLDPYTDKGVKPPSLYKGDPQNQWDDKYYVELSGTSQGTAWVSALAALLYEVNPDLTPEQVKEIITSTANPLRDPNTNEPYGPNDQGAGLIDAYDAVMKAIQMRRRERASLKMRISENTMKPSELPISLKKYLRAEGVSVKLARAIVTDEGIKVGYLLKLSSGEELILPLSPKRQIVYLTRKELSKLPSVLEGELLRGSAIWVKRGHLKLSSKLREVPPPELLMVELSALNALERIPEGLSTLEVRVPAHSVDTISSLQETIRELKSFKEKLPEGVHLRLVIEGKRTDEMLCNYLSRRLQVELGDVEVQFC